MESHPDLVDGPTGMNTDNVLTGPIIVACHWNMLSPVGPALQEAGGSRPRSINSCYNAYQLHVTERPAAQRSSKRQTTQRLPY